MSNVFIAFQANEESRPVVDASGWPATAHALWKASRASRWPWGRRRRRA